MTTAMSNAEPTAPQQRVIGTPFKPGQSGNPNGRPKGSRNRLAESFISDLRDIWEAHGIKALEKCAVEQPEVLIKVVASLLPKQAELNVDVSVMADVTNVLQAFRIASDLLGVDPASGLKRLRKIAPMIEHGR
jgi:hypothetical protein